MNKLLYIALCTISAHAYGMDEWIAFANWTKLSNDARLKIALQQQWECLQELGYIKSLRESGRFSEEEKELLASESASLRALRKEIKHEIISMKKIKSHT